MSCVFQFSLVVIVLLLIIMSFVHHLGSILNHEVRFNCFFLLVQACAPFEVGPKSSTSSSHVFLKLRAHPNLVKALGFCCY
jgi:hypothetical protein